MKNAVIPPFSIDFLKRLSKNNNREWFNTHKALYIEAHQGMVDFTEALHARMNKHDELVEASGKQSLFRIYADVRFAKDKKPYRTHWGGFYKRATKKLRGGYYFHIEPGNSYVAGGFFGPNPEDLKRIRLDIDLNDDKWRTILNGKSFKKIFGKLKGDQVATAPKGFPKDHPAIDLLRYKQFIIQHDFSDKEVLSPDFMEKVNDAFKQMRPFFDHMSEILTTDLNGVEVV